MKQVLALLTFTLITAAVSSQSDPQAYALFRQGGKSVKFKKMLRDLRTADVILFGEAHNDPIAHWLQREVAAALGEYDLGLEMIETHQQAFLEAYRRGEIDADQLDKLAGGMWNNFATDYQPLIDATDSTATVTGTNIPRKYARMVFRGGFENLDSLPQAEKKLLPPLPVPYDATLPAYVRMLEMMPGGHGGKTFPMAQAVKDASMAYRIAQNRRPGRPFLHLNGSYHSDDFEGINWYLQQYTPELRVVTISTVEQEDLGELAEEHRQKANYILAVPTNMPKTY